MQYYVAIRAGDNAEGIPPQWVSEATRIRARAGRDDAAFEHDTRPALPAEHASNPLASVMSADELRAHQRPLSAAFNAARLSQATPLAAKREKIGRRIEAWKARQRERGMRYSGARISLSVETLSTLAVMASARTSLTYPLNAFGLRLADAPALRALEVATAIRLAEIEERAAALTARSAAADIDALEDIALELE